MVTKLTKHQEKAIQVYYKKWLNVGLRTKPFDKSEAFKIIDDLYGNIGRNKPMKFIFDSPMACLIAYIYLQEFFKKINGTQKQKIYSQIYSQIGSQIWSQIYSQIGSQVKSQIRSQIGSQIRSQIGSQIYSQIYSQIGSQIWSQIRSQIGSQIYSQIGSQVKSQIGSQVKSQIRSQIGSQIYSQIYSQIRSQIGSQIRSQIGSQIRSQIGSQIWSQIYSQIGSQIYSQIESQMGDFWYGNHNSNWVGYYQYYRDIFGLKPENKMLMDSLCSVTEELHWFLPYENMCIMSQHPIDINRNGSGLHADGKPALKYADGYSLWSLHGTRVSQYLAETPAGQLDIEEFKKETNADVKAEFIRKFGIERMLHLGKKIDDYKKYNDEWWFKSEYELWDMASIFEGISYAPHLKMRNQTTGVWHLEGVSPDCKTLPEAIEDRLGRKNLRIINIK